MSRYGNDSNILAWAFARFDAFLAQHVGKDVELTGSQPSYVTAVRHRENRTVNVAAHECLHEFVGFVRNELRTFVRNELRTCVRI